MDDGIDADAPLDYATVQIFPNQNRFEAFVFWEEQSEKVAAGILEHLLPHVPDINVLYAKGFDAKFDLRLPENLWGAQWFSKVTVRRFLQVVGFPDLLNGINAIMDEMSQLEESKTFHLSLYGCNSTGVELTPKPEVNMDSSDASKNELLRAMDLRLIALSKELVETFSKAVDATCSPKDMTYLVNFCRHFGATNIEYSLCKFIELNQKSQVVGSFNNEITTCDAPDDVNRAIENPQIANPVPVPSVTAVKYGVSPAKVAQVERQSSTESEESSDSRDEGKVCVERSRTLIRSASPRRSASPMRRVQIGRAGPRRAAALTIKSLNFIPARERPISDTDASGNGCAEEGSEKLHKKAEIDVRRITVQDAISLFESKQRDQTTDNDLQKRRSLTDVCMSTNKSVLRRWSAGMEETSVQSQPEIVAEDPVPVTSNGVADGEISKNSEVEEVSEFIFENHDNNEIIESDVKPEMKGSLSSNTSDSQGETSPNLGNEVVKRLAASAAWNQQKQAEFNQILMKMMESKPVKYVKSQPSRNTNPLHKQRGESDDHYKEKRDAKLQGENAGKRVEKAAQSRAMHQTVDKRKAVMASKSMNVTKKKFTQKPQKSLTQPENSLKETAKPSITKKTPHKASPMPTTRKSWSSTPSPRTTRTSPTNILCGVSSSGSTRTRRKSQPLASVPQPSPRKEKPDQQNRNEKKTPTVNARDLKTEKNQPAVKNKSKATKTKLMTASLEISACSKTSLGDKKSSVMPLESKPFLLRGSGDGRGAGNIKKKMNSPQSEESLGKIGNPVEDQKSGFIVNASDSVSQHSDKDIGTIVHENAAAEPESQINSYPCCVEPRALDEPTNEGGDIFKLVEETPLKIKTEEKSTISPSAWVEIEEEEHLEPCKPCEYGTLKSASPTNIALAGSAIPRVRHSLSQMLQEECSEPETIEWGKAEIPPAMIYQKDAPKGLKRLLKFARKSKGDRNSTGWSSPYVFSEGEDDADECKNSTNRNADVLLRKTALNAKGYGQPKSSLYEGYERNLAESNLSKLDGNGSHKMQNGCDSVAGTTTKASRPFFSLSAFRGNKPL